ncbi:MAG: hypothetical protein JW940_33930 [Polyangiaceae bacterium]|nr:hypothetical protein [Polyangiaceae bacterium]
MARRCRLSVGRFGLLAMLWASPSMAEPPQLTFDWNAPRSCPTEQDVLAVVTAHVGAPAESLLLRPLTVRAHVFEEQRWVLELEWTSAGASEQRRVEADSCAEIARAAALLIALAIDPARSIRSETEPPASSVPSSPPAEASTAAPAVPVRRAPERASRPAPAHVRPAARPARPAPRLALAASAGTEFGALPGLAPGAAAGMATVFAPFELQADVGAFRSSDETAQGAGGRFWDLSLALRPCARLERNALALSPCLSAELVALNAAGQGMRYPSSHWVRFVRLGGGARASFGLGPKFGLLLDGWLQLPLRRPEFTADGPELFQTKAVNARLSLGLWHLLG